ncbi:hypothetical protein [Tahibacter amnicola]|uniref:Uncharacterized protein n=1 Tax=Tahibacter amnicola TaxID=2976241 RepID=A0ABY6BDA1_9GAMM|nr:hypothetical protein [Tahibacter amnicola]UXI66310.1 hypothetical protein N4264_16305 [Tahibacter amnicola]
MMIQLIDILIGLSVVYLIFSTVASSAVELVETMARRRARFLLNGIEEIFKLARTRDGDGNAIRDVSDLVKAFYESAPVAALYIGDVEKAGKRIRVAHGELPSYIPAVRFAGAVIELAQALPGNVADDTAKALQSRFAQVLALALRLYARPQEQGVNATLEVQRDALVQFFNDNTERMSSWYRRHVQWILLATGFVFAVTFNVDTFHIVRVLSQDSALRTRIVTQALADMNVDAPPGYQLSCSATGDADNASDTGSDRTPGTASTDPDEQEALAEQCEKELREGIDRRLSYAASLGLPIGWHSVTPPDDGSGWWGWLVIIGKLLPGWLVTALAICVGAPFWFDLINRLANIRTAMKPDPEQEAAAG